MPALSKFQKINLEHFENCCNEEKTISYSYSITSVYILPIKILWLLKFLSIKDVIMCLCTETFYL